MQTCLRRRSPGTHLFLRRRALAPIAAALLLVEGMIQKVGRFQNTREYLPRVKEELLSMGKMVEDVLSLNQRPEDIKFWQTRVGKLLEEGIARCPSSLLQTESFMPSLPA